MVRNQQVQPERSATENMTRSFDAAYLRRINLVLLQIGNFPAETVTTQLSEIDSGMSAKINKWPWQESRTILSASEPAACERQQMAGTCDSRTGQSADLRRSMPAWRQSQLTAISG
jgi:hypothetical protein